MFDIGKGIWQCHPERSEGSGPVAARCFAALSMTVPGVILSKAKDLSRGAARCFAALSMTD
jgi:hypothetical protein